MLGVELAYDPKIKVVTLLEFYNFALGYIAMQTFYDIVHLGQTYHLKMMT